MPAPTQGELTQKFSSIFAGGTDRFVLHKPPFVQEKSKTVATWVGFAKYGNKPFTGGVAGEYVPVTDKQYKDHLDGTYGLAISPLIAEKSIKGKTLKNVCAYGIIDIDYYSEDFLPLVKMLYGHGYQFSAFESKSGGLHLYFIFEKYEKVKLVRAALQEIVDRFGLAVRYSNGNGVSKVELFPERDEAKVGVANKGVLLPFCGTYRQMDMGRLIMPDGARIPLGESALKFIKAQLTSTTHIKDTTAALPYMDAPFCVQSILLTGLLAKGEHRNDFLFTVALYLKLKHGAEGFVVGMLKMANARLADPLSDDDVQTIFKSAQSKDFPLLGQCKKEPMVSFCNKILCQQRDFSAVKKQRENVSSNVEFGKIYRMKAAVPYYLLEAKLVEGGKDTYTMLRIDNSDQLLNQRTVQTECIDKLGQIMWSVKQTIWEERINEVMQTLEEKEVDYETDTSELGELRMLFHRYLTHRQVQSSNAFRVTMKQVHFEDGTFYFQTDGLKDYLRMTKFNFNRLNLREILLQYGCMESVLSYERKDGTKAEINCWAKPLDRYLKRLTVYFEDMYDQDDAVIEENKVAKRKSSSSAIDDLDEDRF